MYHRLNLTGSVGVVIFLHWQMPPSSKFPRGQSGWPFSDILLMDCKSVAVELASDCPVWWLWACLGHSVAGTSCGELCPTLHTSWQSFGIYIFTVVWEILGSNSWHFITLSLQWFKMSRPLCLTLCVEFLALNLFSCPVLASPTPCLCLCVVVPGKALTFFFSFWGHRGSLPIGQTVGINDISFLAIGMFPKCLIGKFQIVAIFMSCVCALDPICASWGFLCESESPCQLCLQFHHSDLHAVRVTAPFNLLDKLCSIFAFWQL